jgi:hypothetical protein
VLRSDALEMARRIPLMAAGSMVTRSFWPLAFRTTIWLAAKSTSCTGSRQHSSSRSAAR